MGKETGIFIRNSIPAFFPEKLTKTVLVSQQNWAPECYRYANLLSITVLTDGSAIVAGFMPWRLRFDPTSSHLEFVMDNVVPGVRFLRVLFWFPLPILNISTTSDYLISSYVLRYIILILLK